MYELLIFLLHNEHAFDLQDLQQKIEVFYAQHPSDRHVSVSLDRQDGHSDKLKVQIDDYAFYLTLNCEPYVNIEAKEIAAIFLADQSGCSKVAAAKCRIELNGARDPQMDYFNDMLYLVEIIEKIAPSMTFDPGAGRFLQAGC